MTGKKFGTLLGRTNQHQPPIVTFNDYADG
jgi:hypothetical protein